MSVYRYTHIYLSILVLALVAVLILGCQGSDNKILDSSNKTDNSKYSKLVDPSLVPQGLRELSLPESAEKVACPVPSPPHTFHFGSAFCVEQLGPMYVEVDPENENYALFSPAPRVGFGGYLSFAMYEFTALDVLYTSDWSVELQFDPSFLPITGTGRDNTWISVSNYSTGSWEHYTASDLTPDNRIRMNYPFISNYISPLGKTYVLVLIWEEPEAVKLHWIDADPDRLNHPNLQSTERWAMFGANQYNTHKVEVAVPDDLSITTIFEKTQYNSMDCDVSFVTTPNKQMVVSPTGAVFIDGEIHSPNGISKLIKLDKPYCIYGDSQGSENTPVCDSNGRLLYPPSHGAYRLRIESASSSLNILQGYTDPDAWYLGNPVFDLNTNDYYVTCKNLSYGAGLALFNTSASLALSYICDSELCGTNSPAITNHLAVSNRILISTCSNDNTCSIAAVEHQTYPSTSLIPCWSVDMPYIDISYPVITSDGSILVSCTEDSPNKLIVVKYSPRAPTPQNPDLYYLSGVYEILGINDRLDLRGFGCDGDIVYVLYDNREIDKGCLEFINATDMQQYRSPFWFNISNSTATTNLAIDQNNHVFWAIDHLLYRYRSDIDVIDDPYFIPEDTAHLDQARSIIISGVQVNSNVSGRVLIDMVWRVVSCGAG